MPRRFNAARHGSSGLALSVRDGLTDRVDARQGDGHQRVAERTDTDRPRTNLAFPARRREAPRWTSQRDDTLAALALAAGPQEDARGAQLEPSDAADLDLERALVAANLVSRTPFDERHVQGNL
jgi:hypothetical protein